ncbi:MAG: PD-(D/E)XK nuclease family transposase [Bacilli bacterium]|nr:PD-(D/E)XK nuclease family transposase [Bacilli bacterium]
MVLLEDSDNAYDDIFKIVFGREENADITAYLVSLLLKIPYERVKGKIKFKSTSHIKKLVSEKNSEKDIVFLVETNAPLKLNLEMNRVDYLEPSIIDRNVYFQSNLFGSGLKRKNEYENLTTTIQYNFNLDYVDEIGEELIDEFVYTNRRGYVLTEKSKIVHLNIKKMAELWYNNEYKKYKEISPILFELSALILETDKKKFEHLVESIKMDKNIKEQLERIVMDLNVDDELVTKYYNLEEERKKMNEAVMKDAVKRISEEMKVKIEQEAKLQGLEQKEQEVVLNMYKENFSLDVISKITNLSLDEINKIIDNNQN